MKENDITMIVEKWYNRISWDEPLIDIGQISKEEKRELERLVRAGHIKKYKARWAGVIGTEKTHYAIITEDERLETINARKEQSI